MSVQDQIHVDKRPQIKRRLGPALVVIATAQLMLVLDGTIVNVALPSIQKSLGLAVSDLNWVITAYALTFGGLLLAGGRAGDLFGRRRVFRIGLMLFTLASLFGGFATGATTLIVARALQGAGAAIAAPNALALLTTTFPAGPARNKALGVYGSMAGLGSVIGLLLGGALTEYLSWRWILFVNIPIAVAVLLGSTVLVEGERDHGRIDLPGAITATFGLGSLVYAINRATAHGWGDGVTLAFLTAAAVLIGAFLVIQPRSPAAMLPPRILADRVRAGANVLMLLVGAGMFATFYFLTLYMQVVKGYSPMQAGLAYLPFALGVGVAAGGIGPRLLERTSERTVTVIGLALSIAGMAWLTLLRPGTNPITVLLPAQLIAGLGIGLTFTTVTILAVRGLAPNDTGIAAGLINTGLQVGGALGLATLSAIATSVTASQPHGTALTSALTHGYTAGLLGGGLLYLAALIVVVLTIKPPTRQ